LLVFAGSFFDLFFDSEDESRTFLYNVLEFLPDYTASDPRRESPLCELQFKVKNP
jgi:hypothetical protein